MAFPKTFHICVEGTIGVGKSTFLSKFTDFVKGRFNILTLPEPVGTWTNYGQEGRNLLDLMYQNEPGASLHFQLLALLSKVKQVQNLEGLILSERSILAQRNVFIPALLQSKKISSLESELLTDWVDTLLPHLNLKPDYTVYLQCSSEACLNRIKTRNRPEEEGITLDYLKFLGDSYDDWLLKEDWNSVLTVPYTTYPQDLGPIFEKIINQFPIGHNQFEGGIAPFPKEEEF